MKSTPPSLLRILAAAVGYALLTSVVIIVLTVLAIAAAVGAWLILT